MSAAESGAAIIAPPPNPMMAIPVAMPRRSGNQRMRVDTGGRYPMANPHPPVTPSPGRPAPDPHDAHPGAQPAPVGRRVEGGGSRGDLPHAYPAAADHPVAEQQQPE